MAFCGADRGFRAVPRLLGKATRESPLATPIRIAMFQKEEARLARSERPDALHGGVWVDAEPNQDGGELSLSRLTGQPYCRCDVPKRRSPAQGGLQESSQKQRGKPRAHLASLIGHALEGLVDISPYRRLRR
jgi:hypothetical protein